MVASLALAAVHVILLGVIYRQRTRRNPAESWLIGYTAFWAALLGLHAVILSGRAVLPPGISGQFLAILGLTFSTGLASLLTVAYLALDRRIRIWAIILVSLWIIATAGAKLAGLPPLRGTQLWLSAFLGADATLGVQIAMIGWLVLVLLLSWLTWRTFLSEPLPLYANRILYWSVIVPFLMIGGAVSAWLYTPWNYIGYGLHLLGTLGAVHGVVAHRVFDLREGARWIASRLILLVVTGSVIYVGITAAIILTVPPQARPARWGILVGWALLTALLLQPAIEVARWLLHGLTSRRGADPAETVERYSQLISRVIELDQLAEAAARTINNLLGTRSSRLLLVNRDGDQISLEQVQTGPQEIASLGMISIRSPIYQHFIQEKRPLPQYDIDYHKRFIDVAESERHFFSRLAMDIYAPIISEDEMIGVLAVGPKTNDEPFRPREIDLLAALANQTVAALQNARLVNDLRDLNQRISALNEDLSTTNERLERIDAIKTDFLTIASHELRTPLTQIQGYSDVLLDMAEQKLVELVEIEHITRNLGRATRRMTDIITALTDVTEIDIENMDLDFTGVSLAEVIKAAIEPYAAAISERRQTLVARGLRSLPPIQADYKRLVQVFTNLITNAIKFTPDGGEINITGQVFEKDKEGQPLSVRILIEDQGIGIDKSNLDLVFEKFFRTESVEQHSSGVTKFKGAGPGLGLAIARSIVEGHGGHIWVESPGHDEETYPGSTFYVVLPLKPPAIVARQRIESIQSAKEDTLVHPGSLPDGQEGATAPEKKEPR